MDGDDENEDDEEDLDDEEDDDDDEGEKLVIENEYVSEKLSALYCLQEICKFRNPQLFEFYKSCIEEAKTLTVFCHVNIRKEAYLALAYLISYYYDFCSVSADKINVNESLECNFCIFKFYFNN